MPPFGHAGNNTGPCHPRPHPGAQRLWQRPLHEERRAAHMNSLVHCSIVSVGLPTVCPMVFGDEKIS